MCLLCWGTATTSFTIPVRRKAVTTQGSAELALEILNLKLLLFSLHFYSEEAQVAAQVRSSGLCSHPPARWVLFLASPGHGVPCWSSLRVAFPCTVLVVGSLPRIILLISMTVTAPFL